MKIREREILATVLSLLVGGERDARDVRELTELPDDIVESSLARLERNELIRRSEAGRYRACQVTCGGPCMRYGSDLTETVAVDPESLRWLCESCWLGEAEYLRGLTGLPPERGGGPGVPPPARQGS